MGGTLSALEFGNYIPLAALMLLGIAALLGAVLLSSLRRSPWTALIALAFTLGVLRVALGDDAPAPTYASAGPQQVEGVVLNDVEALGSFARFRLELERIRREGGEWMAAEGTLLVTARANVEFAEMRQAPYFRYGDRLLIEGVIEEPPDLEAFDYTAYLARQGIVEVLDARSVKLVGEGEGSAFYRSLYEIRRQLAASIATAVPEPQAALGQATLLGLRRNIPTELTEAFRRAGTAHLLAISGLHVGILLGIGLSVSAALLGRKHHLHLIAPLVVIWLYGLLSGMSPSATRACIMGSVYLVSLAFGRQRGSLAPIGCAATVMVAVSPSVLYSISFQLSFAAIAGIAAFSDLFGDRLRLHIERLVGHRSMLRAPLAGVTDMLAISLAATLATFAAACIPLRARIDSGNTCFRADAACAAVSYCGQRGYGPDRACEYDVRDTVRLACVGRGRVLVGRDRTYGRAARRFGRDWRFACASCCRILRCVADGIFRNARTGDDMDGQDNGFAWFDRLTTNGKYVSLWANRYVATRACRLHRIAGVVAGSHGGQPPGGRPPARRFLRCGSG